MTIDFNSAEYQEYLKFQQADNVSRSYDDAYLPYLFDTLLKDFDYTKARTIDVGCRQFDSFELFRDKFGNLITGVDIGKEGIFYCQERNKTGFIEQDAHTMLERFGKESFDLIISFHAFEHMLHLPVVLKNCYDMLSPGGYFYFAIPLPCYDWGALSGHRYSIKDLGEMTRLCDDAGFTKLHHAQLYEAGKFRPEQEGLFLLQK